MSGLPTEIDWVLDLYVRMLANPAPDARMAFVFRHPVLMSTDALQIMLDSGLEPQTVIMLDGQRRHLFEHPAEYPRGVGPTVCATES